MVPGGHKILRGLMAELLLTMGRSDPRTALDQLAVVLRACEGHLASQKADLHPMLAECAPRTLAALDAEIVAQAEQIAELRAIARALITTPADESGGGESRTALGHTLYLQVTVFIAERLLHLAYEERVIYPLLAGRI